MDVSGKRARGWDRVARLSRSLILCVAIVAVPTATIAQSRLSDPGIGGTGHQPGEGNGIGGTGQPFNQNPGIGGTGIIGTITGFGSILVNGYEVDYAADQPINSDFGTPLHANALRVGQVVAVDAEGDGQHLRARTIAVQHEVAGRIDSVDRASGTFMVLGQTVSAENGIVADKNGQSVHSISDLAVGDSIEVSGLRRDDGVIAASRIEKRAAAGPSLIRGTVTAEGNGTFAVSGYHLALAPNHSFPPPTVGTRVAVTGSISQGSFVPRRVERVPETPFGGRLKRLSIEGFVGRGPGSTLSVGGMPLAATKGAAQSRFGERVIINGPVDEHRHLIPERMQPAPMNFRLKNERGNLGAPGKPTPDFRRGSVAPGSPQQRVFGPHERPFHAERWRPNRPHWWARRNRRK
jgi:Domain of unknown function (DUF5666)